MLLNEDVMKSASVGSKKGYFATFFIPPADDDECVFQDIVKTEKEWRPETSLSHHTTTSSSRSNRGSSKSPRARTAAQRGKPARGKSATFNLDLEFDDEVNTVRDRKRVNTARSSNSMLSWGGYSESTPPPPPSRSAMRNPDATRNPDTPRRSSSRGPPVKYAFDQGKSFATPTERTKKTCEVIKDANRGSGGDSKERTCRPYSSYTVYQKRENIAISPYGESKLKGAAGRYREQYQNMTNSVPAQTDTTKESRDYVFKRFFENLTARSSLACRSPIGTLKKPPPKPVRKPTPKINSKIDHLHRQAKARMTSVQKDLGRDVNKPGSVHRGVEYVIAMEMSHNLEKHRMKRSYSFPSLPTVAVAASAMARSDAPRLDKPRLRTQSVNHLTLGESSIRGGIETNAYDVERVKRGPVKCIERKARVPSPPLSKLSRDRFLPEAVKRREYERQESLAGLRITANTPVTDWKTETDRRPKSSLTVTTKMQADSLASKSIENLDDINDDRSDDVEGEAVDDNLEDDGCAVEELYNDDEREKENTQEISQDCGDNVNSDENNYGDVNEDVHEDIREDVHEDVHEDVREDGDVNEHKEHDVKSPNDKGSEINDQDPIHSDQHTEECKHDNEVEEDTNIVPKYEDTLRENDVTSRVTNENGDKCNHDEETYVREKES